MLHSPPRQSGRDAKRPAFGSACGCGAVKHLPAELLAVGTLTHEVSASLAETALGVIELEAENAFLKEEMTKQRRASDGAAQLQGHVAQGRGVG